MKRMIVALGLTVAAAVALGSFAIQSVGNERSSAGTSSSGRRSDHRPSKERRQHRQRGRELLFDPGFPGRCTV